MIERRVASIDGSRHARIALTRRIEVETTGEIGFEAVEGMEIVRASRLAARNRPGQLVRGGCRSGQYADLELRSATGWARTAELDRRGP